jgi:O-Antigen ligase
VSDATSFVNAALATPTRRWEAVPQRTARPAPPTGLDLLRPVYWILAGTAGGAAYHWAHAEGLSITLAAFIALWAFFEPRLSLSLATGFMIFLFVFFQSTAPLGEDLPQEFLYWSIGVALITTALLVATLFSRQVDWKLARKRLMSLPSVAMLLVLLVILASSIDGIEEGNSSFIVARQLFGCLLLPAFFYLALALLRHSEDVAQWLGRVSWLIAFGSIWYVVKLSSLSFTHGFYYREQSPLVAYSGAIAVVAWTRLFLSRRAFHWPASLGQLVLCVLAILLMGNRAAFGSSLAAVAAVTVVALGKRRGLPLALAVCFSIVAMGLTPYVITRITESRGITGQIADRFIFALSEDRSYQGRVAQTEVVLNMVNKQPVLGAGMGSVNSVFIPGEHRIKVASVDNGWGFLLLKMGYLGAAVFLAFIGVLLKIGLSGLSGCKSASRTDRLAIFGVFIYALVSFLGGPIFFHFSVAPFFGTFLGALVACAESQETANPAPAAG